MICQKQSWPPGQPTADMPRAGEEPAGIQSFHQAPLELLHLRAEQEHAVAAGTHLQGTIYRVTEHHGTHTPRSDHREPFLVHFPGGEVRTHCEIRGSASGGLEMGRRAGCNNLCRKLGHPCGGRKLQHSKPLSFQNRLFSLYRLLFSKKINF